MPNKQPDDSLEPDAMKVARPVLRGEGSSDALPPTRLTTTAPVQTRRITATDLYRLRFVDDIAIAPDGSRIACTVTQPDGAANRNRASIWIVPVDGGEARQVTSGEKKDTNPAWSPDGTKLAFVSDRGTKGQIFILDLAGGEAQRLTQDDDHAASEPVWSPDGASIAYLCKLPSVPEPVHNVDYKDDADKPKIITRAKYKYDGEGFFDHTRKQLCVVPAAGGERRQLTTGTMGVGQIAWSPDGTRIAFAANRSEHEDRDRRMDIWTVEVASGSLTQVTPHDGSYGHPAWSPDGATLAFVGHTHPAKGGANDRLWTAPATGGAPTQVTDFDRSIGSGIMSDTGSNERSQPVWIGNDLYFLAAMNGTGQVWRVAATGGAPTQVTAGTHAIAGWDITRDGALLAFGASTPTSPGELSCQPLDGVAQARTLTSLNAELADVDHGSREEFWLPAGDGTGEQIQGWIIKPPGFDPTVKYPLLLEIHGGPAGTYGVGWFHEFQYFAAQGYVVVYTNPRGSQGYGEAFCTSIYQDWGTKPLMDVLAAVDHVIAQGYVDTDRLYVTGGSYGGYMTNWVVTHSDRFRAGATQRCVSDLRTLALADDTGTLWLGDYLGGMPWDEPEVYARNSPITYIANCRTPLFIEHEEEDHRCPMDQAEQVYNALHKLGVETELIRYPKEPHGMSRDGGPLHRVDRLQRIIGWFERHK